MNRTITGLLILALCLAAGHALQCYKCDLGLGSLCLTSKTTCQTGELCFNGKGTAAGVIKFTQKGCLAVADCNKTSNVNIQGSNDTITYEINKTCCATDLCNTDTLKPFTNTLTDTLSLLTNTHTPLTNTLTLTIGSLVSLLLAKMLM
ncbi:sperm acrosome membrane-associated protein 4-like [Trichomycterus rosablanca]|uniref:sperm acrosome membrane-associated protein 4-like n=1 Tax=Trichomycterus rosablanca TaxID=2290929 RepID=UPI002F3549DD